MIFKGDMNGSLTAKFKCTKDPWIYSTSCVFISSAFAPSGKSKVLVNWQDIYSKRLKPVTTAIVSLSKATQLSKNSAPPPPPPPPAKKKKLQIKKAVANNILKATPDLTVAGVGHTIIKNCKKNARAVEVKVGIKNISNKDFKNPSKKFMVLITDKAASTKLHSIYIPAGDIPAKQTIWVKTKMAYYGQPSKLAGTNHFLEVKINPYKIGGELKLNNNKKFYSFQFPKNHCMKIFKKVIKR